MSGVVSLKIRETSGCIQMSTLAAAAQAPDSEMLLYSLGRVSDPLTQYSRDSILILKSIHSNSEY
jgi:hypothetical protein